MNQNGCVEQANKNIRSGNWRKMVVFATPYLVAFVMMIVCSSLFESPLRADPKMILWMADIRENIKVAAGIFAGAMGLNLFALLLIALDKDITDGMGKEVNVPLYVTMATIIGAVSGVLIYIAVVFPGTAAVKMLIG